jgi:hypothetical protein
VPPAGAAAISPADAGGSSTTIEAAAGPVTFVPLSPARVLDTRPDGGTVDGAGPKGELGPGQSLSVPLAGRAGLPSTGIGPVVLNVTTVQSSEPTYLTVWPSTSPRPLASNLNPSGPTPLANLATVRMGDDGSVSIYNAAGTTHVIADVNGYYPAGGGYVPVDPVRLADTRPDEPTVDAVGPKGAIDAGQVAIVPLAGRGGVPAEATAVVLNLTAVSATATSYLTVWPTGGPAPEAYNLNPSGPAPLANLVTTALGADGTISVLNAAGSVHVAADVAGYYLGGPGFTAMSPSRVLDTRVTGPNVDDPSPVGGARRPATSRPAGCGLPRRRPAALGSAHQLLRCAHRPSVPAAAPRRRPRPARPVLAEDADPVTGIVPPAAETAAGLDVVAGAAAGGGAAVSAGDTPVAVVDGDSPMVGAEVTPVVGTGVVVGCSEDGVGASVDDVDGRVVVVSSVGTPHGSRPPFQAEIIMSTGWLRR